MAKRIVRVAATAERDGDFIDILDHNGHDAARIPSGAARLIEEVTPP